MEAGMDDMRFDSLTRHLSTPDSRRGVFKTLGAASLGLGLLRLGSKETLAKHHNHRSKRKKKSPPPPTQYLGDTCLDVSQCVDGLQCEISNSQNSCYANAEQRCCT